MSVDSDLNRVQISGSGTIAPIAFNRKVFAATDIIGSKEVTATGVVTSLVQGTDYSVTGAGNTSTGVTITPLVAPAVGERWVFWSDQANTQASTYTENDRFPAKTTEYALDKQSIGIQDQSRYNDLALRYPDTEDSGTSGSLPVVNDRKSKALGFDANGDISMISVNTVSSSNASGITYDPAGAGAVATTVQAKLRESVSVEDFGAIADDATKASINVTAFNAAITYCATNKRHLNATQGLYYIDSTITVPQNATSFSFDIGVSGQGEQANTGLMWKGGDSTGMPAGSTYPTSDYGTGAVPDIDGMTAIFELNGVQNVNWGALVVSNEEDDSKGIVGIRWTGPNVANSGFGVAQHTEVTACEFGMVLGQQSLTSVTYDSVAEAFDFQYFRASRTRHPLYIDRLTADWTKFSKVVISGYISSASPYRGEADYAIRVLGSGNGLLFEDIGIAQHEVLTDLQAINVTGGDLHIKKCAIEGLVNDARLINCSATSGARHGVIIENMFSADIEDSTGRSAIFKSPYGCTLINCSFVGNVNYKSDLTSIGTQFVTGSGFVVDGSPAHLTEFNTQTKASFSAVLDTTEPVNSIEGELNINGRIRLGTASELTIATGAITVTGDYHRVDTESNAASDDLDTINGMQDGDEVVIRAENGARTVVLKDGTGNLSLGADISLDDADDIIKLFHNGTNIVKIGGNV